MRIDQLLPDFGKHDAIGNHVLETRRLLRSAGYASDIYAGRIDGRLRSEARPFGDLAGSSRLPDAVIYHDSTDSDMASWLVDRGGEGLEVLTYYHNITPAEFFSRWEPRIAARLRQARSELASLAPHVSLAMAASSYNESDLDALGYANTVVVPLLVDLSNLHVEADSKTASRLARAREAGGGAHWLFVGRIAPNKCQHDVVAAFALYRRLIDPRARLTFVGSPSSMRYLGAVRRLAVALGVEDAVEHVTDVSAASLLVYYRDADVFVCLSEHEGFCVPILEAMDCGLPVVAFAAAAVPETLGASGFLLEDKDPILVACAVERLLADQDLRHRIVAAGTDRAAQLSLAHNSRAFLDTLETWLSGPSRRASPEATFASKVKLT